METANNLATTGALQMQDSRSLASPPGKVRFCTAVRYCILNKQIDDTLLAQIQGRTTATIVNETLITIANRTF